VTDGPFSIISHYTTELQISGIVRNITYTVQPNHRISERYNGRYINLPLCCIVSGTDLAIKVLVPKQQTGRTFSYACAVLVAMSEHRHNYVRHNYRQLLYNTLTAVHNITTTQTGFEQECRHAGQSAPCLAVSNQPTFCARLTLWRLTTTIDAVPHR
jgi:hypothetical protein